jgi:hypothetical protein
MKLLALAVLIALPALSACGPKAVGNSTPAPAGSMAATPVNPASNSNSSEKRKEIRLEFKDVPARLHEEGLVKKLGKPLKTRKVKRSEQCSDGPNKIFEYPGLTVELIYDSESGDYKILTAEAASEKWPLEPGLAIGSEIDDVLAKIGEPTSRSEDDGFLVLRYETGDYVDGAEIHFRNGKLAKIKIGYKECLDEN